MSSDYSNGKIYLLSCNVTGNVYVGSTTTDLQQRLQCHKAPSSRLSSMCILENNDYTITLLQKYPCETKLDLLKREQFFIDNIDCVNKNKAYATEADHKKKKQEYIEAHIDVIREQRKVNGKRFFDKWKGQKQQCNLCGNEVSYGKMKRHQASNRCRVIEKIQCDICGLKVTKHHIARHKKTEKCKNCLTPQPSISI